MTIPPTQQDYEKIILKINNQLISWSNLHFALSTKIMILNTYITSQFQYLLPILKMNPNTLSKIENVIKWFLFHSGKIFNTKVKFRSTISLNNLYTPPKNHKNQNINKKLIHLPTQQAAAFLSWLPRIHNHTISKKQPFWIKFFHHILNTQSKIQNTILSPIHLQLSQISFTKIKIINQILKNSTILQKQIGVYWSIAKTSKPLAMWSSKNDLTSLHSISKSTLLEFTTLKTNTITNLTISNKLQNLKLNSYPSG